MKKSILLLALLISVISLAINFNKTIDKDISITEPSNNIVEGKENNKLQSLTTHSSIPNNSILSSDYDGDGVLDDLDLDDDNDGILDIDEKGCDQTIPPNGTFPVSNSPSSTPQLTNQLLFWDWSGVTLSNTNNTIIRTVVHNGITYTATITNFNAIVSEGDGNLYGNDIQTWANALAGKYYNVNGTTFKEALYQQDGKGTNTFNVTFSAKDTNGKIYPVEAIVFDAESTSVESSTNYEYIELNSNATPFKLLEKFGTGSITSSTIVGEGTSILRYKDTSSVNAFYSTTGTSPTVNVNIYRGSSMQGKQAVGFAIRLHCDTDNDGIPNHLDYDSDGDGCPDAIEGGDNIFTTQLDSTFRFLKGPVNSNGIPTVTNTGQDVFLSQEPFFTECDDWDYDFKLNDQDLDDDNDGILDTEECNSSERVFNGIFPTAPTIQKPVNSTYGNTSTLDGWIVDGTYSTVWPSTVGEINLNSNGLEFRRDEGTVTRIHQNMTNKNLKKGTIILSNVKWYRSTNLLNQTNSEQNFNFELKIGKITYLTISNPNGNSPIVKTLNSATSNIGNLSSVPVAGSLSANTNSIIIQLPYDTNLHQGDIELVFTAGSSARNVHDLMIGSISINSCQDTDNDGIQNIYDLDSDNDGCTDAIEGGIVNIYEKNLVEGSGFLFGEYDSKYNLGKNVDNNGVPTIANGGQSIGNAYNMSINDCICYKPANNSTQNIKDTNIGITTVSKDSDWPQKRKGGFIALESKSKGLVINRLSTTEIDAIANPTVGMIVYDITIHCLKIYGKYPGIASNQWHCYDVQTCQDI